MEKVPRSTIPDIDKKKFLVPADLSGMPSEYNSSECLMLSIDFIQLHNSCTL